MEGRRGEGGGGRARASRKNLLTDTTDRDNGSRQRIETTDRDNGSFLLLTMEGEVVGEVVRVGGVMREIREALIITSMIK